MKTSVIIILPAVGILMLIAGWFVSYDHPVIATALIAAGFVFIFVIADIASDLMSSNKDRLVE